MTTINKSHLTFALSLKGMKPNEYFGTRTDMTATKCSICSKALTDAESVQWAVGPVCRKAHILNVQSTVPCVQTALNEFWGYVALAQLDSDLENYLFSNESDFQMMANIITAYCSYVTSQSDGHSKIVKLTPALRAIGYTNLADRLEEDRCKVLVYPQHSPTHIKLVVPTNKKQFESTIVEFNKYLGSKAYTLVKPNRTNRGAYFEIDNTKTMETLYALGKDFSGERFFTKGSPTVEIVADRASYGTTIQPCAEFLANVSPLIHITQNNDRVSIQCVGNPWSDNRIKGMQTWAKGVQGFKWASGYVLTVPHTEYQTAITTAQSLGYETWEIRSAVIAPYVAPQPTVQPTTVQPTPKATVSPTRVGSDWGVWSNSKLCVGDYVTVSTKSGKSWLAVVTGTTNHSKKYLTKSA
jgi:hypothetical protein